MMVCTDPLLTDDFDVTSAGEWRTGYACENETCSTLKNLQENLCSTCGTKGRNVFWENMNAYRKLDLNTRLRTEVPTHIESDPIGLVVYRVVYGYPKSWSRLKRFFSYPQRRQEEKEE